MSDDLKDIIVDWSEATPIPLSPTNDTIDSMITLCTEGTNLIGIENAEQTLNPSFENFSKNDDK